MVTCHGAGDATKRSGRKETARQRFLYALRTGDAGVVEAITETNGAAKRLADIGFVRGAILEMIHPGAPCIVRVGGTYVGLGLAHQRSIRVGPSRG